MFGLTFEKLFVVAVIAGSAAHPVRVRIDSLSADDPRRIAAESTPATQSTAVDFDNVPHQDAHPREPSGAQQVVR